jgi:hypothetical protein
MVRVISYHIGSSVHDRSNLERGVWGCKSWRVVNKFAVLDLEGRDQTELDF